MNKLSLCRMCLAKNVPMHLVVKKNLQEMFKQLTAVPFVTDDCRPAVACVVCCARLRNCYEFMNNCLQSEQLLQQVLSSGLSPVILEQLPSATKLVKSAVLHTNCIEEESVNEVHGEVHSSLFYETEVKKENCEDENIESSEEPYVDYEEHTPWCDTEVDPLNEYKYEIPLKSEMIVLQTCHNMIDEQQSPGRVTKSNNYEDTCLINNELLTERKLVKKSRRKPSNESPEDRKLQCGFCKKYFNFKSALSLHLRIHTGEKPFKCNVCNKSFNQKSTLVTHYRVHTGEKPFKCNICGKRFTEKEGLVKHTRTHTGDKPFECKACNKCFTQKGDLAIHNRIHTGHTPYHCNECSAAFTTKRHLVSHNRIHTGDTPYKCDECSKCFANKRNLLKHRDVHTDGKPHKCGTCSKYFASKSKLECHNRIHTGDKPYMCSTCSKCFTEKSSLVRHIRIHTGDKPYKCEVCSKSFSERSNLVAHRRTHSGDKPHKCAVCSMSFNRKSHLARHARTHSVDKSFVAKRPVATTKRLAFQ